MKYKELAAELAKLTPEELEQSVTVVCEDRSFGKDMFSGYEKLDRVKKNDPEWIDFEGRVYLT